MKKERGVFLGISSQKEPIVFERYSRENSKKDLRLGTLGKEVSINIDEKNMLEKLKSIREENIEKVLAKAVEIMKIEENYAFNISPSNVKTEISIYPLTLGEKKILLELALVRSQIGVVDCQYGDQVMEEDIRDIGIEFEKEFGKEGII